MTNWLRVSLLFNFLLEIGELTREERRREEGRCLDGAEEALGTRTFRSANSHGSLEIGLFQRL